MNLALNILKHDQAARTVLLSAIALLSSCFGGGVADSLIQTTPDVGNNAIKFSPLTLNLGNTQLSPSYTESTVTLTNKLDRSIFISSFVIDNTDFSVAENNCPMAPLSMDAAANCTLTIRFSPNVSGDNSGTMTTKYGLTADNTEEFTMNYGLAGRATLDGVGNSGLTFNPTTYDFGDVAPSPAYAERSFVVSNVTVGNLYLSGFSSNTSVFSFQSTNCPVSPLPILPSATCNVIIRFSPLVAGRLTGTLTATYGVSDLVAGALQSTLPLVGSSLDNTTLGNSALTFSPSFWDFGDLGVGITGTKVINVTNSSTSTVFISTIAPNPVSTKFAVQSTNCPVGLNPFAAGVTCSMTIAYTPTGEGSDSANIKIAHGPNVGSNTILSSTEVVTGRSSPAPISTSTIEFSPTFWDFGDVAVGNSASKSITITNTSAAAVFLGSIERTSTANFALSHNCPISPTTFAAAASCSATVTFSPSADGSYSTDLSVNYGPDAPRSSTVQTKVILIGRSIATPIGNAAVSFSPDFWDYGDVAVGQFQTTVVTVTNSGTVPIFIGGISSVNSDFNILSPTCPTGASSLGAASTCTFSVRYIPAAIGAGSSNVVVSYGLDQARNTNLTKSMVVSGRSTAANTGNSAFTVSPTFWDFGDVAAGVTVQKVFSIQNSTLDPVYISNITRTNSSTFGVSNDCPISPSALAANAACNVTVTFSPTSDAGYSSVISVLYGPDPPRSGNNVAKFAVAGRSTAATNGNSSITYSPIFWNFGDVPRDTFQDKVITLTNSSAAAIYLSHSALDVAGSFLIAANTCPAGATPLNPAATCTITLRFAPTADVVESVTLQTFYGPDQARSGNLIAKTTAAGRSLAVPAGQAIFGVSPAYYDYGDVARNVTASNVMTVTNSSANPVYISSITRSNTANFGISHNCPASPTALASGATCNVTLTFTPTAEGEHTTSVNVAHGLASASASNLVFSFYAQGRSITANTGNAALAFTPTTWDYGDIAAGQVSNKSITITNSSASAVFLGSASNSNALFTVTSNTCPTGATSLAAAATCTINLRFSPVADGGQSGVLSYTYGPDQARNSNLVSTMTIFGRSVAQPLGDQAVTFTPSYWDFGDVARGQTSSRAVVITNAYSLPIYISGLTTSNAVFGVSDNCPRSPSGLASAATCTITSGFSPVDEGGQSSVVRLAYGPDAARATNLRADLDVSGRSTDAATGNPGLSFNPTYKDFENILVGQFSSSSFTITNIKTVPLYIGATAVGSAVYSITANTCPSGATALAPAGTCTISVRYTPTTETTDISDLSVSYGPDQARNTNLVATATLIAKSEPPPVGNAAITLSPNTFDFGNVGLTPAFSDTVVTVSNSSARNLYLGTISGLTVPYSVNASTCPTGATSLSASASCTLTIRFSPTSGPQVTQTMTLNYGVSSGDTTVYNSQAQFTGRSNPSPPTNFRYIRGDDTTVTFAWDAIDSDQSSFEIQRCNGATCSSSFVSAAASTALNTDREFTASSLTEGDLYAFRIRGVAGSTNSTWLTGGLTMPFYGIRTSDNSTGTSGSLSQISCTSSSSSGAYVGLTWTSLSNAAYYQVFDVNSGSPVFVKNVDAPASGTVLTGVANSSSKSYLIRAFTTAGFGSPNQTATSLTTTGDYTPCGAISQTDLNAWGLSPSMLNPRSMAIDGGRLFVADTGNNRVLIWNTVPTSTYTPADVVLGQPDFDSLVGNNAGLRTSPVQVSAKSLNGPQSVYAKGSTLVVADTGNHRVLIWNSIPTTSFAAANVVLGQINFTSRAAGGSGCSTASPAGMNAPSGVFIDSADDLYVSDTSNNRVLVWTGIPTINNRSAGTILGSQGSGAVAPCPIAARTSSSMWAPAAIYVSGSDVFVTDRGNNRILRFTKNLSNGMAATAVLGQANFTDRAAACTQGGMSSPYGVWGDSTSSSSNIYVADYGCNRALRFASGNWGTTTGTTADSVIGQTLFTGAAPANTTTGLNGPFSGYALNSGTTPGGVWVLNYAAHRINKYTYASANSNLPTSTMILGQPQFTTSFTNSGALDIQHLLRPYGISVGTVADKMAISDVAGNRVLLYDQLPTTNLPSASRVIGQTSMTASNYNQTNTATAAANSLSAPMGVWTDGVKLLVADSANHRIMGWRTWPTADGQNASFVLGQNTLTAATVGSGINQLNTPASVFASPIPGAGSNFNYIWVADRVNSRVVAYQTGWTTVPPDPSTSGQSHVLVLGQPALTGSGNATTQSRMNNPRSVWSDGQTVIVADTGNNRVLIWDGASTPSTGQNADFVLGQVDFVTATANTGGISASSLNQPTSVFVDNGRLFVVDQGNHRVLIWNSIPNSDGQAADRVLGQTNFIGNTLNGGLTYPAFNVFNYPTQAWIDAGRMFLTDGFRISDGPQNANTVTNNRAIIVPSY